MKKEDKRGLSTVIATLLIILLVIISVVIVWTVVKNVIIKGAEDISIEAFQIDLEIVSIKQNPTNVDIKVRRNPGEGELEGIIFSIFDGQETHLVEVKNVSLKELETKIYKIDYSGNIVRIDIFPLFLTQSGKTFTGGLADSYNYIGTGAEIYVDPSCVPDCTDKECGDNGCGGSCGGCSGSTPYCISGNCQSSSGGVQGDCSCATTICEGTTCDNGLGESCYGLVEPDCTDSEGEDIMCGDSENTCGDCGTCATGDCYVNKICCDDGYHSVDGEICVANCDPVANCLGKLCGSDGCGGSCGYCDLLGPTWLCNSSQLCEECTRECGTRECGPEPTNDCGNDCGICIGEDCGNCTREYGTGYECNLTIGMCEMCTPECEGRECGDEPNGCGTCGLNDGECENLNDECIDGICIPPEARLNWGTVYSIWPTDVGAYFDSSQLNQTFGFPNGYFDLYWVKIPAGCFQIDKFVTPLVRGVYNLSYIKFVSSSTPIQENDPYEIWETLCGCNPSSPSCLG